MKRTWAMLVAGVVIAGSLIAGSPAQAGVADCELGPAPQPTAIEGGGQIRVYPDRVPDDALALSGWLAQYVLCLEGGTAAGLVECLGTMGPSGPYVWYEEETGAVVIDYERIRNDWFRQPNC